MLRGRSSARAAARSALCAPSGGSEHQAEGRRTAEGWSRSAGCGEAAQSERGGRSYIEAEVHHIAVLDDVLLPFEPHLAVLLRAVLALRRDEVGEGDDFRAD